MLKSNALNWLALILVIIGGINWGLVAMANLDLVAVLFGAMSTAAKIVYSLVALSAVYLLIISLVNCFAINR